MKKTTLIICTSFIAVIILNSCKRDSTEMVARMPNLPQELQKYDEITPGANGFVPTGNIQINNQKATLGRVLFYETQLSINNRVSCGSCHHQSKAFADKSAFSSGFENATTTRNTPAIINPGTQSSYFWDMRENNLMNMVVQPIANHIEMGLDRPEYIVAKVQNLTYYEPLFTAAFGDASITIERIGDALQNFVSAMVTTTSKYDIGASTNFSNFTAEELEGKELFNVTLPCASCHGGENFAGWGSFTQNIGLDMDYSDNGQPGTDWITGHEMDGWFKVPSLRNVELTGPYMHDGRFSTLEEVVDFYDHGIQPHPQLSFSLQENWGGGIVGGPDIFIGNENNNGEIKPLKMNLTPPQKKALIAFLKTLTDQKLISDSKFSDPFRY